MTEPKDRQPAGLVGEEAVGKPPPLLEEVDPMRPRKFFYVVACLRGSSAIFAGGAAPAAAQAADEPDATDPLPEAPPPADDAAAPAKLKRARKPRQPRKRKTPEEKAAEAEAEYPKCTYQPKPGTRYPFQDGLNFSCISRARAPVPSADVNFFPCSHGRGAQAHVGGVEGHEGAGGCETRH